MSRISSLKFPILHDIKDTLFGYYFYLKTGQQILPVLFLIQSKLHTTITAKTQHSQNSVGH